MSAFSPKHSPIHRLIKATGYSIRGLNAAWRHEASFRLEVWLLLVLVPLAIWLADSALKCLVLIGVWLLVMIVELINSAIEAVVDRIGSEMHELSGRAKDIGSAAVMLSVLLAIATWGVVIAG